MAVVPVPFVQATWETSFGRGPEHAATTSPTTTPSGIPKRMWRGRLLDTALTASPRHPEPTPAVRALRARRKATSHERRVYEEDCRRVPWQALGHGCNGLPLRPMMFAKEEPSR